MKQISLNLPENLSSIIVKHNTINGYIYDNLSSTNDQIWQLRQENIMPPFFVIAKQQTAGKGQRGNIWRSPLGGLYLSMILEINLSIEFINHLTLFSVYGIVKELRTYKIPVQIKWLNDLILEGKKLGGILCETRSEGKIIKEVVMGVGINYKNEIYNNSISLNNYYQKTNKVTIKSANNLAKIIILGILKGYQEYLDLGINHLVNNYNKLMYNFQDKVTIEQIKGEISGINSQGHLQVKITSLGASSKMSFSPQNYSISYDKLTQNYYQLTEKNR